MHSLVLCNSFSDTSIFNQTWTANRWRSPLVGRGSLPSSGVHVCLCFSFWLMPAFLLKKIVLGNFARGPMDPKMADGIDFMVDRVRGRRGGLLRTVSELCGDFLTKPASLLCGCVPVVELLLLCVCSWRVSTKAS